MTGFDADWLARREPFDARARDGALAVAFARSLRSDATGVRRIIDLAAGTGSNFRALAPRLGGDQEWLLVDHDPRLREAQAATIAHWAACAGWTCQVIGDALEVRAGAARWLARAHAFDLAGSLEALDLHRFDGVSTSAFLDLVSADWLDRLVDQLAGAGRPLLAVLTVDGRRDWAPPLAADRRLREAFQRHQGGDKGFGPALGGDATAILERRLVARGFAVATAPSDWRIDAAHCDFLGQLVREASAVACEAEPLASADFTLWRERREAQIQTGRLALTVGHTDLLAVPPWRAGADRLQGPVS